METLEKGDFSRLLVLSVRSKTMSTLKVYNGTSNNFGDDRNILNVDAMFSEKRVFRNVRKWVLRDYVVFRIAEKLTIFFCSFYSIVDDSEMYEQQKPFRLDELVKISAFLNNLVFKMLWNEMVDGRFFGLISQLIQIVKPRRAKRTSSELMTKITRLVTLVHDT